MVTDTFPTMPLKNRPKLRLGPLWLRSDPRSHRPIDLPPSGWTTAKSTPKIRVRSGSRCVKGGYRKTNEDRCFSDGKAGLYFVADGMGGYEGGAEASRILVETLPAELASLPDGPLSLNTVQRAVEMAVDTAYLKMADKAERHINLSRMGATLAMTLLRNDTLFVCRVGDCRVYLIRDGKVTRLTDDQTFVQVLVDAGMITNEEARDDPRRHLVLNAISAGGLKESVQVEAVKLEPGDRVVLVSDGLTSAVEDDRLGEIVTQHPQPQEAADELVLEALRNKSRDNVACVAIKALPDPRRCVWSAK